MTEAPPKILFMTALPSAGSKAGGVSPESTGESQQHRRRPPRDNPSSIYLQERTCNRTDPTFERGHLGGGEGSDKQQGVQPLRSAPAPCSLDEPHGWSPIPGDSRVIDPEGDESARTDNGTLRSSISAALSRPQRNTKAPSSGGMQPWSPRRSRGGGPGGGLEPSWRQQQGRHPRHASAPPAQEAQSATESTPRFLLVSERGIPVAAESLAIMAREGRPGLEPTLSVELRCESFCFLGLREGRKDLKEPPGGAANPLPARRHHLQRVLFGSALRPARHVGEGMVASLEA